MYSVRPGPPVLSSHWCPRLVVSCIIPVLLSHWCPSHNLLLCLRFTPTALHSHCYIMVGTFTWHGFHSITWPWWYALCTANPGITIFWRFYSHADRRRQSTTLENMPPHPLPQVPTLLWHANLFLFFSLFNQLYYYCSHMTDTFILLIVPVYLWLPMTHY